MHPERLDSLYLKAFHPPPPPPKTWLCLSVDVKSEVPKFAWMPMVGSDLGLWILKFQGGELEG